MTCSNIKNGVIQSLREENVSLKNRIKTLEAKLESSDLIRIKMDKYSRRNNVAVNVIPSSIKQREPKDKCTEVFGKVNIKIDEFGI